MCLSTKIHSVEGRAERRGPGFTLIELLVAIAVLALVSVILAQMLAATSQTWLTGQAKVNNFTKGRAMLDLLARDLQSGVYRSDLPSFPGGAVAFYTERPGFSGSTNALRNISWVNYDLGASTNATLQRADLAVEWNATNAVAFGSTNAPAGAVPRDTAPGVVGFKIQFLYADGSLSTNYSSANRPKAVSVGLAVIDDKTLERLQADPLKIAALRNGFASHASGTNSVKADWEEFMRTEIVWESYPKSLATGLKVFERYVALP
jgi:prepilin-type N-terminal cleavage/methylation domain-containing protein